MLFKISIVYRKGRVMGFNNEKKADYFFEKGNREGF